jgi:hypothetical protein
MSIKSATKEEILTSTIRLSHFCQQRHHAWRAVSLLQIWAQQLEMYIDRVPLHLAHMFCSPPVSPIWPCSTRSPLTIRGGKGVIELGRPMIPLMTDRGPRQKAYCQERPDSTQKQQYMSIIPNQRSVLLHIIWHFTHTCKELKMGFPINSNINKL